MNLDLSLFEVPIDLGGNGNVPYQKIFMQYCAKDSTPGEVIIGPEGLFSSEEPLSVDAVAELVDTFLDLSKQRLIIPGTMLHEINGELRNTAYVFANGKLILTYNKETESQESAIYNMPYKTGGNTKNTFVWQESTFGLEICRDHGMGRLKKNLDKTGESKVDYQVVIANNAMYSPRNFVVQDDGFVVLVDGNKSGPSVSVTNSKNSKLLNPITKLDNIEQYLI